VEVEATESPVSGKVVIPSTETTVTVAVTPLTPAAEEFDVGIVGVVDDVVAGVVVEVLDVVAGGIVVGLDVVAGVTIAVPLLNSNVCDAMASLAIISRQ